MKYPSIEKPWLKYTSIENYNRPLPQCSMYAHLKNECEGREKQVAIDFYGTHITYSKMIAQIDLYADHFASLGVKANQYITFLTVSIPETVYAIYALNKLGAVCNFIDVRTDTPHIIEFTQKAHSEILIVVDAMFDKIKDHINEMGLKTIIVQSSTDSLSKMKKLVMNKKSSIDYSDSRLISNKAFIQSPITINAIEAPYIPDQPAVITRTGGTTGKSKGVMLTNDCMNANDANARDSILEGNMNGKSILNFLPLAASYGIVVGIHIAFCRGAKNILIPKFTPKDFAPLVCKYKPNYIIGVPVFYENLMTDSKASKMDYSFITAMISGGDSANSSLEQRIYDFVSSRGGKYPLAQGYGMSESTSMVAFGALNIHKPGSAGIPCVHSTISAFKVDSEQELPIGQIGEICISGPTVMKGYLDEEEETNQIIKVHKDGTRWIHSGDLGRIDEDGFLFIEGRIKRSIIRFDGHKVYPLQLEEIVERLEAVKTVCVIPVKDMDHDQGDLPLIIIEANPSVSLNNDEIVHNALELCKENIELRSQPAGAIVIDSIPHTSVGKNDVMSLIKEYGHYQYK